MNHLQLDLDISFAERRVRGSVTHHLEDEDRAKGSVLLHTRGLDLDAVEKSEGPEGPWFPADHELGAPRRYEGQDLVVQVDPTTRCVRVRYRSRPDAEGLQWLEPEQTAGREAPFVYSQGQTNHNRTWIPCFDDPAKRITFEAEFRVDSDARVVMAAEDLSTPEQIAARTFRFAMPQPIPSYLIAMAAGRISFRDLGPRTGVWAEPELLDRAVAEFEDTESMIEAVEQMFGSYRWGRYDLLVLPPSFPLGGMENPRLTFLTPTVIAGDKSLVSLIAHELAHSWSGNLVTNGTWNDLWLNEGFTVYLERRIQEKLYGPERAEMEAMLGRSHLEDTLAELAGNPRDTWLEGDFAGRSPDDSMSLVPYEKGYLLLRLLEEHCGRERFDAFLRHYFDRYAFETMTTDRFLEVLDEHLLSQDRAMAEQIRVAEWVRGPGIPANAPSARSSAFEDVERAVETWVSGGPLPLAQSGSWSAHEWIHFLRSLPRDLDEQRLAALDAAFDLTAGRNAEILCEWLLLALRVGYAPAMPRVESFLIEVGRRKFVKPLFEELVRTEEGRQRARAIYATSRKTYHAMTSTTVDQILARNA